MNYLSKKNFGIPAMILASISVLLGYGLYAGNFALLWVTLAFAGIVYLFDFDEVVKASFRQSMLVAFYGWVVKLLVSILNTVLHWFSGASTSNTEAIRTIYKVFAKIVEVISDGVGFLFVLLFIVLLLAAIQGKVAKISLLNISGTAKKETAACPKCGEQVEKGAAFCPKCGNKME
ncbi:MAG: zinc ribbon domain-containing protein [Lachnospiraceae bacterium]|nr:zinc ribbon domain-containing protein [Lachnospiraceae bacterium]